MLIGTDASPESARRTGERRNSMPGETRDLAPNPASDAETSWRINGLRGPHYPSHLVADAEDFSRPSSPCACRSQPACHTPVGLPNSQVAKRLEKTLVSLDPRKPFCEEMDAENR